MTTDVSSRRLVRRTDDRIVAGVASGLAAYLGIDPVLVRVLFVLAVFAGGFGFIAYAAIWFLAPEGAGEPNPAASRTDRNAGFWVAIALFLLGGLALADNVADRSLVWPVLLIGVGVALWRSDLTRPERDDAAEPTTAVTPSVAHQVRADVDADLAQDRARAEARADRPSTAERWRQRRAERHTSPLGGYALAATLLAAGGLLLLDQADVISVAGSTVFAAALLVLGLGLLVGSVVGRARWLVVPAVFVVLPLLVVSTVTEDLGLDLTAGVGERQVVVASAGELEPSYEYGVGEFLVDLTRLDTGVGAASLETETSLAIGQLTIVVPDEVTVVVDYDVALGATALFGETDDGGADLSGTRTFEGSAGGGRLELQARLGLGELVLLRDGEAVRP